MILFNKYSHFLFFYLFSILYYGLLDRFLQPFQEIMIRSVFASLNAKNKLFFNDFDLKSYKSDQKTNKEACFIHKNDYPKYSHLFEKRDPKLASCMMNVDPLRINQTEVLLIGSKKKVGRDIVRFLKNNSISYGRIKNRYHIDVTMKHFDDVIKQMNYQIIIDLSNNLSTNNYINSLFRDKRIIRTYFHPEHDFVPNDNGNSVTIITDRIFQPLFLPNAVHKHKPDDINYYIFDKYVKDSFTTNIKAYDSFSDINKNFILDVESKSTHHQIVANKIIECFLNSNIKGIFDLRKKSQKAKDVLTNFTSLKIKEIQNSYIKLRIHKRKNIYVSHVTITSDNEKILYKYRLVVSAIEKSLAGFYNLCSIEFVCATNVPPEQIKTVYSWMDEYPLYKSHVRFITVPNTFLNMIKTNYSIDYFPEYFYRNIGLRRGKGRYMISGSSDVLMPPHFFLASAKHLFSKLFYFRSSRIYVREETLNRFSFSQHYITNVKKTKNDYFFRSWTFPRFKNLPEEPYLLNCGDYQGFHREFWFKLNAYLNCRMNFNIDSLLAYRLFGLFNPIVEKISYGQYHYDHPFVSGKTPHFPFGEIYALNIKDGDSGKYNGTVDWGYPECKFLDTYI